MKKSDTHIEIYQQTNSGKIIPVFYSDIKGVETVNAVMILFNEHNITSPMRPLTKGNLLYIRSESEDIQDGFYTYNGTKFEFLFDKNDFNEKGVDSTTLND